MPAPAAPAPAPARPSSAAVNELPRGARPARPSELVELRSGDSAGGGLSTSGSSRQLDAEAAGEVLQPARGEQQQQAEAGAAATASAAALPRAGSGTGALPDVAGLQAAAAAKTANSAGGSSCSADGAVGSGVASGERKRRVPVTHVPEVRRRRMPCLPGGILRGMHCWGRRPVVAPSLPPSPAPRPPAHPRCSLPHKPPPRHLPLPRRTCTRRWRP